MGDQALNILVMAGGSGTRFWPKSRKEKPKQLLSLWDDKSLIEHTIQRFESFVPLENIWIITTYQLLEPTKKALGPKYEKVRYLGEPSAKNTAACILWGTREIEKVNPEAIVAVMPADHYIGKQENFLQAVRVAAEHAQMSKGLVTLGIKPDRPETGYGYIEVDGTLGFGASGGSVGQPVSIRQFVEKPDLRTALRYIESGKFFWNAGMFMFTAKAGLEAFEKCMPSLANLFLKSDESIDEIYSKISAEDAVSVDYGVMETAESKGISVFVVPTECAWNDVGSFTALEEINVPVLGKTVSLDSPCNIVQSDSGIVALLGVNDLVVVRDKDVVLVCAKDRAQDIKTLLERVKEISPESI